MKKFIRKSIREFVYKVSLVPESYFGFRERYGKTERKFLYYIEKCRWFVTFIVFGASAKDYVLYEFNKKTFSEMNSYITLRRRRWFTEKLNAGGERYLVEDKTIFADRFKKFMGREAIDMRITELKVFKEFVIKLGRAIAKPIDGFDGKGIFIINKEDDLDAIYLKINRNYIVEEIIKQTGILHKLNPGTVNTIRVNALQHNGGVKITTAIFRIGCGDGCVDNFHGGGIATLVDINTGIVAYQGVDMQGKRYLCQPDTKEFFLGLKIPCWERVIATVTEAALLLKDVPYTSWDIAVAGEEIVIVEGNTYGNTDFQQSIDQIGKWNLYKNFTKQVMKERKEQKRSVEG